MSEFDLIARYFAPLAGPEGQGLLDDAAHFSPTPGFDLVLTKDSMVEGVHFPNGEYGADVAERLLRVNLSDLAAKAASPRGYLLSMAWPKNVDTVLMADFAKGLAAAGKQFGIKLWGGDTVAIDGPAVFSATLIGECPEGMAVKRRGAKADDDIWLSGFIGKGYFGLRAISESRGNRDIFYRPPPRLELKPLLQTYASAAVDISDGFAADLEHILKASHVSGAIELNTFWYPDNVQKWLLSTSGDLEILMTHGDDYEVIFTAHKVHRDAIEKAAKSLPFRLTRVGQCGLGEGLTLLQDGEEFHLKSKGYSHF